MTKKHSQGCSLLLVLVAFAGCKMKKEKRSGRERRWECINKGGKYYYIAIPTFVTWAPFKSGVST